MFGYIKPFKPELKLCEYDAYKAVYCGLCGQLGKSFGPLARLTLSYDFTFLCMLHYAVGPEEPLIAGGRCCVNPLKRVPKCGESEVLRFGADTAAIMIYYKLLDNMQDSGKIARLGWRMLHPLAHRAYQKAARRQPECGDILRSLMEEQRQLEQAANTSVDAACEPTAKAIAALSKLLGGDETQQRVLERLGYLVGRYIYLCDALDDLAQDLKSGNYNPFVLHYGLDKHASAEQINQVCENARQSLYASIAEAAKAFELLEGESFRPVLGNILMLGMRASVEEILAKKEKIK